MHSRDVVSSHAKKPLFRCFEVLQPCLDESNLLVMYLVDKVRLVFMLFQPVLIPVMHTT